MSEVGSGDDAKRSDFGQGFELGVAKKVSPLPRIVRAWGIEGFRDPVIACRAICASEIVSQG